jgi:uncharacterized protein YfiM (DUF2279 family)
MYSNLIQPGPKTLLAASTVSADSQTAAFQLPLADSFTFWISSDAGTGTSPTLDIALQVAMDGLGDGETPTVWKYAPIKITQITTSDVEYVVTWRPNLGNNEDAYINVAAGSGTAVAKNFVPTKKARFAFDVGGSTPVFANVTIYMTANSRTVG